LFKPIRTRLTPSMRVSLEPAAMGADELQRLSDERAAASDAIVNSAATKRLIVSGPGTGKSFTFRKALAKAIEDAGGGKGLALTFIRNLVVDLLARVK
jgi:hypothetical protein